MATRWIVECVWSGYRSSQERACHREVIRRPKLAENLSRVTAIVFTDGTQMSVSVRACQPREKVKEILGYKRVIGDLMYMKDPPSRINIMDIK